MVQPFDEIVSLGASCTAAWQIRHHFAQARSFPFDWLVTPFDALVGAIEADFEGLIDPQTLAIDPHRQSIHNLRYRLSHVHDFPKTGKGVSEDWRRSIAEVGSKFDHLLARWRKAAAQRRSILFVRHQGDVSLTENAPRSLRREEVDRLAAALARAFPHSRIHPLLVSATPRGMETWHPDITLAQVPYGTPQDWPDKNDRWKGATAGWTRTFEGFSVGCQEDLPPSSTCADRHVTASAAPGRPGAA